MPTGLLLVAHGSPDPRHAATMRGLADEVRGDLEAHVTLGFLEHNEPSAPEALAEVIDGNRNVVAVSLLLTDGYHADVDLVRVLSTAPANRSVTHTGPLGLGSWLFPLLDRRVRSAGDDDAPVIVCASGSARDVARRQVEALARDWAKWRGTNVQAAFVTGSTALLEETLSRADGSGVVVPLLLAPGVMHDRMTSAARAHGWVATDVLAPSAEVVDRIVALARGQVVLPDVAVTA